MAEISLTGDQMLTVLEAIAHHGPVSAAEVSRICSINRTVAHRLITTLALRGYVRRTGEGYVLGGAIIAMNRFFGRDISSVARPLLRGLAEQVGETIVLHCIDRDEAVVTDQALADRHLVRVHHVPGTRHPLFMGASGWSMLAFQDENTIARVISRVADPDSARLRIEETRRLGYAVSRDELQMGVHGIAAPVIDPVGRCQASIAVLVPSSRAAILSSLVSRVIELAEDVSAALLKS